MQSTIDALAAPVLVGVPALIIGILMHGDRRWLLISLVYFTLYSLLLEYVAAVPDPFGGHLNWFGKLLSCGFSLSWVVIFRLSAREVGLSVPATSAAESVPGIAAVLVLAIVTAGFFARGAWPRPETWLFQASMPGLDEELAFRGLEFACLLRAFAPGTGLLFASIATTLMFSLGHGLSYGPGGIHLNAFEALYTLAMGSLLIYLRVRSHSLLVPIIAHNLANVGAYLTVGLKHVPF